jgi:transposase
LELTKKLENRFPEFDLTPQHLGKVIRDHNKTRKRTRKEHFPEVRYGRAVDKQAELNRFYRKVDEYRLNKIICLDETSIQLGLVPDYSRCELGKRCVSTSNNNNVFKKYTLLSAISSTGIVGYKLYEQGGMTTERFIEFLDEFIVDEYRNHLIIVDNAGAHRNEDVRKTINESGNELLYAIPYTPKTNAIENWFSQLKHYLKKDGVLNYRDLQRSVRSAIRRIRPEHYLNYFRFAYRKAELRTYEKKLSTKHRSPKVYK